MVYSRYWVRYCMPGILLLVFGLSNQPRKGYAISMLGVGTMADGKEIFTDAKEQMRLFDEGEAPKALKNWFSYFGIRSADKVEAKRLQSTALAYYFPANDLNSSEDPVILVHGYLEHCGYLHGHINRFNAENRSVICLELPGHGLSTYEEKWSIDDFRRYALATWELSVWASNKFQGQKANVLCHSTGCVGFLDLLLASSDYLHSALSDFGVTGSLLPTVKEIDVAKQKQFDFGKIYFLAPLIEVKAHALISLATAILPLSSVPRLGGVSYEEMRKVLKKDPANQLFFPTSWTKRYLEWHKRRQWVPNPNALTRLIIDKKDSVVDSSAAIEATHTYLSGELVFTPGADHFLWFYKNMPSLIK